MLYNSEEAFVDKFIACLKLRKVTEIPFDNKAFYTGIEKMRQVFQINRNTMGKDEDEISLLFIKKPLEGTFSRFRDAISEQNGWYISFINPEYVRGVLMISDTDAKRILEGEDISIPRERLEELTEAFCKGANLV